MRWVLVANRGEIAVRILRTVAERGYRGIAVHTLADSGAPHVALADRAVLVPNYLDAGALIAAAKAAGADAIHPGYGFLSENPEFAEQVASADLRFIGPPASAIRSMGDKRLARRRMMAAGVPVVPGYDGDAQDLETLEAEARRLGPPLMVKAAAGGGGKGLRRVEDFEGLGSALRLARAEAESSFRDGTLILERAVDGARHVEVQVLADALGGIVHLFERDCSTQRRHQKVLEEAPSPAVDPELRARLGAAAVLAAGAVGYVGAGTVEMLLARDGSFHFMEMNTRLQVEHPVTELVTGLDLVALQLEIAAGAPLPFGQADLTIRGHAIEARLYAEDPAAQFLPATGTVARWVLPPGVRVDHGLCQGQSITADYDPLLAKLIAHAQTREEARRRLSGALEAMVLHGVRTNRSFLVAALEHPRFVEGTADTGFVEGHLTELTGSALPSDEAWAAAAVHFAPVGWSSTGSRRSVVRLSSAGRTKTLSVEAGPGSLLVRADGLELDVSGPPEAWAEVGAVGDVRVRRPAWATWVDGALWLSLDGQDHRFERAAAVAAAPPPPGAVEAPMAGKLVRVLVFAGDRVESGATIAVIEAMKMQLEVKSPRAGRVAHLSVTAGQQVAAGAVLATVEEET